MGQKTHPYGFRLGVIKSWTSKWYEDKRYVQWLHEDIRIKRAVKDYLYNANVASVEVERAANKAKVIVYTARPGFTCAAHSSGAPFPPPMRTSRGFFVTGRSGKTRIQSLPARFTWR